MDVSEKFPMKIQMGMSFNIYLPVLILKYKTQSRYMAWYGFL